MMNDPAGSLRKVLTPYKGGTIAVSGGVDSMTLAAFAHILFGANGVRMVHALSPAVPAAATARLRKYSEANNWSLTEINAGEFTNSSYRSNPINRCFYCKTHLYKAVSELCNEPIMSGTNCDDLQDYRPGLVAARDYKVRHPYVEAGINKGSVRKLARELGLNELAELPASPCLSSRIQTGIKINPEQLALIDTLESWLQDSLKPKTVRCRIRNQGLIIELDTETLTRLSKKEQTRIIKHTARHLPSFYSMPVAIAPYERGSAFVVIDSKEIS